VTAPATSDEQLPLRAAAYQVLAIGYDYPSPSQRERMGTLTDGLRRAAALTVTPLAPPFDHLARVVVAADQAAVEADFNRLFSGQVVCAPHETAYEPDIFRRQRALADIAGFHAAFGFTLPEDSRWQPDHIGVELELCALLLQRQVHAREQGWDEPAQVCEQAVRGFLLDHLGRWYASLARRLLRTAASTFYRELATATEAWVRRELAALRLHPEPLADRPRTVDDDAPPACGAGGQQRHMT
jgi:TorA maturation chaperone TorD